jgi:hypothetical protein
MQALRTLVTSVNLYLQEVEQAKAQASTLLLKRIAQYISRIFTVAPLDPALCRSTTADLWSH